jgi:anti-sigma factor RsiW
MIRGDQHVDDWAELAVDYLDGRLDHDARKAVEAHLAGCPACAARLRRQQYVVGFLQDTVLDDPPADLEYRCIGELVSPPPGTQPVFYAPESKRIYRTPRWYRAVRTWVPAAVAVVAVVVAIAVFADFRSGSGPEVASDSAKAGTATTAAAATTTTAGALGEAIATSAGASTTTAAAATTTTGPASASTMVTFAALQPTSDPKAMVQALENAQAPTFVSFRAGASTNDTSGPTTTAAATTTTAGAGTETTITTAGGETAPTVTVSTAAAPVSAEKASDLLERIAQSTGLQPLDESLWLGGPTFAVYLPRDDASKLIELARYISSALGLLVSVEGEPPQAARDTCSRLLEQRATFPVLQAHPAAQPSSWDYHFTTSTLASGAGASNTGGTLPDEAGTHVLVVIVIAE